MNERKVKAGQAPLADAIRAGDRRALARAITLVESTRAPDREKAESLLAALLPHTGQAIRLGISGSPGAGKSTFIEAFGRHLTQAGKRVAVLAVDPSSRRSGGSILGDKTRMETLARNPRAFIRPSPAGETLGGVARRTREAMLLVEAAGFDVVLVETVGVGQSETAVADMADLFVLLVPPGGGDDLQGIKRGVMELADLILITKADGDLLKPANRAAADYRAALHLMRPKHAGHAVDVLKVSSLEGTGVAEAWAAMARLHESLRRGGQLRALRESQLRRWFWSEFESALHEELHGRRDIAAEAAKLERAIVEGRILPFAAARTLFRRIIVA
ncbi:MAG TPA: methylmalonyl Co-A mutase-associated GTPase MeaB [Rhizomicrobium sp.]|nr:methylmalonyl Co-A mutase-associated GTPase MeaB [Rhizomicrobium sp.]